MPGCCQASWKGYENLKINPADVLAGLYADNFNGPCGKELATGEPAASTDMGNVSHIVPSIHPKFAIGSGKEVNRIAWSSQKYLMSRFPTLMHSLLPKL